MRVFEFIPKGTSDCSVKAWIHDHNGSEVIKQGIYPAIIICPGGAYIELSDREAEPVAKAFFSAGYNTYILRYSVGEDVKKFTALFQLGATIAEVRRNAEEWFTQKDKIAVCGFSAGGHLAASLGTLFNKEKILMELNKDVSIRPDAMVLGYPLVVADEHGHVRCFERVSRAKKGTKEYQWFGLPQHVDADTPPTFLWHTAEDRIVPVENSLKMALALSAAKVSFECHVFPKGPHGMSTCTREVDSYSPYNARWVEWAISWLNEVFEYEK